MIFHESTQKDAFQNIKIKLNLDDYEVLSNNFSGLRTPAASLAFIGLCNLDDLYSLKSPISQKELPNPALIEIF